MTRVALPQLREQTLRIPMPGTPAGLFTRVCPPATRPPFRVVVINHGSPRSGQSRAEMQPRSCSDEAVQWFLAREFMVLLPMRRGFGETGGEMVESSGACASPNYVAAGLAGAQDIAATVDYATSLPDAQADDAVVLGESLGGWAVVAYDTLPHPRVTALISMAGGRGGWAGGQPGVNCRPDLLAAAAAHLASGATTKMLWIYAHNDSYFPPGVAEPLAHAYEAAGGRIDFVQPPDYAPDGHLLLSGPGGSQIWGPLIERYLHPQENTRVDDGPRKTDRT